MSERVIIITPISHKPLLRMINQLSIENSSMKLEEKNLHRNYATIISRGSERVSRVNKNAETTCSFSLFNSFSFSLAIQHEKFSSVRIEGTEKEKNCWIFLFAVLLRTFFCFNMHLVNFLHHLKCTRRFAHNFFWCSYFFFFLVGWYSQHNDVDNHDNGTKIFERLWMMWNRI